VISRKDQRVLEKRDVFLVDKSGTEISLTLWNELAQNFEYLPGKVIGIKGALVREFNGIFYEIF
jgi:ssDNA-binding replication factor A large subunit